ncbi:hypothetical protein AB0G04_15335 [Actinoplanes sp. NPDC023801]|uniref:hypothetical protein n=1 Tax=Actinoplanes sp. NPDC023801 TaxID=3154595 RepID=UPI0033EDD99B
MEEPDVPQSDGLSPAESSYLIDFERADAVSLMIYPPPPPMLIVSGQKPFANMEVTLNPLRFVQQPEYWGIEVIGTMPATGQPAIVPYAVELDLNGLLGTRGVEVIGANGTERIEIPAATVGTGEPQN